MNWNLFLSRLESKAIEAKNQQAFRVLWNNQNTLKGKLEKMSQELDTAKAALTANFGKLSTEIDTLVKSNSTLADSNRTLTQANAEQAATITQLQDAASSGDAQEVNDINAANGQLNDLLTKVQNANGDAVSPLPAVVSGQ